MSEQQQHFRGVSAPLDRRGPGQPQNQGATHTQDPGRDGCFKHRNLPLAMLDVDIGTTELRTEHCYRCAEETLHESTLVETNTWESECTKHRDPSKQRTSEPWRRSR